jgi:hypothetical protein
MPEAVLFAVLFKKHGFDKGDFSTEFIFRIPTVPLTLLKKGAGAMTDNFMRDRSVNYEFNRNMSMFCL